MCKLCLILITIGNLLISQNIIPNIENDNWNILQTQPILIRGIEYNDTYWCQAKTTIHTEIDKLQFLLEDKENYPNVFDRIETTTVYNNGNVQITLDMPFPFAGRDYIVQYIKMNKNNDIIYQYKSIDNSNLNINNNYVRLINAAGEWKLHPISTDTTELTYTWNGELRGDFPDWALTRAWNAQGEEVMTWIKNAIED